jgi:hypothetical protein
MKIHFKVLKYPPFYLLSFKKKCSNLNTFHVTMNPAKLKLSQVLKLCASAALVTWQNIALIIEGIRIVRCLVHDHWLQLFFNPDTRIDNSDFIGISD